MKTALLISLLLGQVGILGAQDIEAIKIDPPFDLSEGTEVELSKDKLRPYKSWLESTKLQLTLMQEGNQTLTRQERYEKLRRGVEKVLTGADQSRNELFTRYILKRAIVIDNTLIEEEQNLRIIDVRLSLLEDSIKMALTKCESDLVYLNLEPAKQGDLDFISFGFEYSSFLSTLARTILDSGAQYKVYRSMLGFFQWDLYRDSNNKAEVANIYRINSALESIPDQVPNDGLKTLQKIKEMKLSYQTVISNMKQERERADSVARRLDEQQKEEALRLAAEQKQKEIALQGRTIGPVEVKRYVSTFSANVDGLSRNRLIESFFNKNIASINSLGITEIIQSLFDSQDASSLDDEDVIGRILPLYLKSFNMSEISVREIESIVRSIGRLAPYSSNLFVEGYVKLNIKVISDQEYGQLVGLLIDTQDSSIFDDEDTISRLTAVYVSNVAAR